jgi:hypothetical protein
LAALIVIGTLAARSRATFVLCHKLRYLLFRLTVPTGSYERRLKVPVS